MSLDAGVARLREIATAIESLRAEALRLRASLSEQMAGFLIRTKPKVTAYKRRRYEEAKATGKCVRWCGRPAVPGKIACEVCAEQYRARQNAAYQKRKAGRNGTQSEPGR